jgi:hypothetical protein
LDDRRRPFPGLHKESTRRRPRPASERTAQAGRIIAPVDDPETRPTHRETLSAGTS